ncbi:MAG: trigger factor [Pseudomonadota bacterium]
MAIMLVQNRLGFRNEKDKPMEVTETKAEGLSRTFKVHVPASELQAKLESRIEEIRPQMRLKGFRPGKVPAAHVKKMFGKSIMGELVEGVIGEANQKALTDAEIRPASQPDVQFDGEMENVLEGGEDLSYEFSVDVMPDFEPADVKLIEIERPVTPIADEEIDEELKTLAEQNKKFEARGKTAKARDGDAVVIDFLGKIDGEAFEGGAAEGQVVELGAGRFIPGFEEQLVGVKAGEETELNVTFPEDYPAENLKGKDAVFEVKVEEVREPKTPEVDEEFAQNFGFDTLDELKDMVRQQVESRYTMASRQKAKRALLDALDEKHDFDLPPKMVDQEFDQIWQQLMQEKEAGNLDEEDEGKSDDELKVDYRKIAERRVRLGLVLAEIGRVAEVQINEQEVQQAVIAEARRYPGQEREVIELFQKNPGALAQIRAPLYEEKVVDHILEVAKVTDKEVAKDDLFAEVED